MREREDEEPGPSTQSTPSKKKKKPEKPCYGTSGKCIRTASRWLTPVEFTKEDQAFSSSFWKKSILCQGVPLSDLIERKVLECHSLLCLCKNCSKEEKDLEEQRNDDNCSVCGKRGHLLCCDRCPRAFHTECLLPAVEERLLGQALDCRTSDSMLVSPNNLQP
ncbi:hypothetical protein COCON_G00209890 [Conger conger]|uniref:SAND domain-containing protein n=1 Tax=Conger conger TaxID=82655 RepID=A0A9Q1HPW1_CONCO|nr:hypothetical protein COCON_G00209890 [Conger conger]